MPWVHLSYSDGEYSAKAIMDSEVEKLGRMGCKLALVGDGTWVAWMNHKREHEAWQEFWLMHDNMACDERVKRDTWWVVFRIPGTTGEFRRGPFQRHEAIMFRIDARMRFDALASYINDLGERKDDI